IGFPVVLKAAGGGGGLGVRVVWDERELAEALDQAQAEAQGAFGDAAVYLEKYLVRARHIEVQVLADQHGHVLHLGERDCSVQRRNQKLLEETPAPALPAAGRRALTDAAVQAARAVGYEGLGTIEFLWSEGKFYFMEMNTRLQVEHPVTEAVWGLDLVAEQIRVAAGAPLPYRQDDLQPRGHAIECRINAEDPDHGFRPSAGAIDGYNPPGGPGIRVDSHCYPGYVMPAHYDSLIAKLIAWGETRAQALARMRRALGEYAVTGIKTTIPFHERLVGNPAFQQGAVTTRFVQEGLTSKQEELV
ncbi:MAG: ATP-grasp domain-containing protein, partial [Nevskia sp.]|nr:ATP-grasp domain-containing protein [Nevskia sp.]